MSNVANNKYLAPTTPCNLLDLLQFPNPKVPICLLAVSNSHCSSSHETPVPLQCILVPWSASVASALRRFVLSQHCCLAIAALTRTAYSAFMLAALPHYLSSFSIALHSFHFQAFVVTRCRSYPTVLAAALDTLIAVLVERREVLP